MGPNDPNRPAAPPPSVPGGPPPPPPPGGPGEPPPQHYQAVINALREIKDILVRIEAKVG